MKRKFYNLTFLDGLEAERDKNVDSEQVICQKDHNHRRGGKRIGNLQVVLPVKAAEKDFIWTWYYSINFSDISCPKRQKWLS